MQRLKDLKQWESGRRFGGHRSEEEKEKKRAAYTVAVERARMLQRYPLGGTGCGGDQLSFSTGEREERSLQDLNQLGEGKQEPHGTTQYSCHLTHLKV